ncbi:MAG: prolipoprotein diacylglyceryl transferase [Bacteroidales bacterium]|nr:prolipoprotein diacylglyceryl transferase [Bacteroidales bacterium]
MTLLQVTWDASPVIFNLGPLSVRWYGLFWALSFYFGYEIMYRIFKRESVPLMQVDKLLLYIALGAVVGARLGHCFFYDFNYYINNPLEILMIWQGGLASHGGAIGIILALYIYQKKVSSKSYAWLLDRLVIPISLGAFFIRMGNLMNSEIYGHQTDLSWGFIFVRAGEVVPKHPTQFYEGIPYLLLFLGLGWLYLKKAKVLPPAFMLSLFAIVMFTVRFLVEFVKEDQSAFEANMTLNMGQWLSLPLIVAGVVVFFWSLKQQPEPITIKENLKEKPKEKKRR